MTLFEWLSLLLGTVGVGTAVWTAYTAVWGEGIRYRWNPPSLELRLRSNRTFLESIAGKDTRYIHLVVKNSRPSSPAQNVVVYLSQIDRFESEHWETVYETGPIPLRWQFAGLSLKNTDVPYATGGLTVGPERICNLGCFAGNDDSARFELSTALDVAKISQIERSLRSAPLRVHIYAEGDNARSATVMIDIVWDGQVDGDDEEMASHLSIHTNDR